MELREGMVVKKNPEKPSSHLFIHSGGFKFSYFSFAVDSYSCPVWVPGSYGHALYSAQVSVIYLESSFEENLDSNVTCVIN